MCKMWKSRPSNFFQIDDPLEAFQLDSGVFQVVAEWQAEQQAEQADNTPTTSRDEADEFI